MRRADKHVEVRGVRAQVAMEYLLTMGFVLLITLPLIIIYFQETSRLSDTMTNVATERAAAMLTQAADTVYYLGPPSKRTVIIELPDNVRAVELVENALIFNVSTFGGAGQVVAWSVTNLTGNFSVTAGPHRISVTALPDARVNLTET